MKPMIRLLTFALILVGLFFYLTSRSAARPPIRKAFFNVYTSAEGTRLDDLTSNPGHCGVCHYDFNGGGARNAYGLAVQVAINSGSYPTTEDAIQSVENLDSDNDGFLSYVEITDTLFINTPTLPGLTVSDTALVTNVDLGDIIGYLTPMGSTDTIPPTVTVISPNGGDNFMAGAISPVTWTASDASGISHIDIYLSDDNGVSLKQIARGEPDDGSFDWFVHNLPGSQNLIKVVARDNAGNYGSDWGDGLFTVTGLPAGIVPTTLRDLELPGSHPFSTGIFDDPDVTCVTCHGQYNTAVEPWYQWKGSMMAQAARDPLFLATLAIAEQDAPSAGDFCLRCHTPGGWLEGRSVDTGGGQLTATDRQGVQCDFCHRLVDPDYKSGLSPVEDVEVLDALPELPVTYANGQYVVDPDPIRRGPYPDAVASHAFLESPVHTKGDVCGTCHDVSNPVFVSGGSPGKYDPDEFDSPHPDGDLRNMFPVERTYSEWSMSDYATTGVFAPQFAGNKPSGIVSTCQDCHMRDVSGKGCSEGGAPNRSDLPLHDLTGGNHFVGDIIPDFYPAEVDPARLQAGKQRAIDMLQKAATMSLETGQSYLNPTVKVTIVNETGHKLPSGYPEGRRIWINLRAYDSGDALVYESGAYDAASGVLTHDTDIKVYHIEPGISTRLANTLGASAGPSFHFVLNDTVYYDNRIPPRGFTNANFELIQAEPVGYAYPDTQYWDETSYILPEEAVFVEATLYYQTTSKEYIEFLRDENITNTMGQQLYDAWVNQGRAAPVAMVTDTTSLHVDPTGVGHPPSVITTLQQNFPNPFNATTAIRYSLDSRQHTVIQIYDVSGRLVRTLVDEVRPAGVQRVLWDGMDRFGRPVASGVYFYRMQARGYRANRKALLLK